MLPAGRWQGRMEGAIASAAHIPQGGHDLIENAGGPGMRRLELQDGQAEVLHERVVVGVVLGRFQPRLDPGDESIQALAYMRLLRLQPIEFRAEFGQ